MNIIELLLIIIFFSILCVPLAIRLHVPLEIFLLISSGIISLIPGLPLIEIKPWIVFYIFLPPILFSAAYFTSWHNFKLNRRPIFLLAFGLVFATACAIALISQYIIPGFSWNEGFLLGAILSPTDASAATTLIKKLKAPRRLIAILEGESLINDATALLIFKFSLIALISGWISVPQAIGNFFTISLGGLVIGLVIGFVGVRILKILHNVPAETTLTLVMAFACYVTAEYFECSGVIATVTGGIYFGLNMPAHAQSQTRIAARSTWGTLIFIINILVFSLIGLELSWVLRNLGEYDKLLLISYAILISCTILVVRMFLVFLLSYLPQRILTSNKIPNTPPSIAQLFILGWGGMRGIVSFAAVLAVPLYINGAPFPQRDALIFITYCVIVITLVVPALTIPYFLNRFRLVNIENDLQEEALARLLAAKHVVDIIASTVRFEAIPENLYKRFLSNIEKRINVIESQLGSNPHTKLPDNFYFERRLILKAINAEREILLDLRRKGELQEDIFRRLMEELDYEELRSTSLRL